MSETVSAAEDLDLALTFWRQGLDKHQQGRVAEALADYDEVVRRAPSFPDAYLNRAVARLSLGAPDLALEDADRLLAFDQANPGGLNVRGVILHRLSRFEEAAEACEAALQIDPNFAYAHNNRGLALEGMGRLEPALASYEQATRLDPAFQAPHPNRGNVLARLGRWAEAIEAYEKAIADNPSDGRLRHDSAAMLETTGRFSEALTRYSEALALSPTADSFNGLGNVLFQLGQHDQALDAHLKAMNLAPDMAETTYYIGRLFSKLGRYDQAEPWFERTAGNTATDFRSLNSRGLALNALWRFEDAVEVFDQAIALDPYRADLHHNRGVALQELGKAAAVLANYDRAIELDPGNATYRTDRGLHRLMVGDFAGWEEAEWRKHTKDRVGWLDSASPPWTGRETLTGKTLFAFTEQGLGDTIQFCRYLPLLTAQGAKVVLAVQPPLKGLISTLGPEIEVIVPGEVVGAFDYHVSVMSLPWAFKTTQDTIPDHVPYLKAETNRVARWRRRLGSRGFKIGISWQGSTRGMEIGKAFRLEELAPIAEIAGVRLISLQKGVPTEALSAAGVTVKDLGQDFDSGPQGFLDTAAVMENLDLVITTDTSVAHLAGALARPTWIALKRVPDWRWGLKGASTPWYPTARLFRQQAINDWRHVFDEMAKALPALIQGKS